MKIHTLQRRWVLVACFHFITTAMAFGADPMAYYDFPPPEESISFLPGQMDAAHTLSRMVKRKLDGEYHSPLREINEQYLSLSTNTPPLILPIKSLKPGLYSLFLYGTVAANGREKLDQVWKPCPMEFSLKDKTGKSISTGLMLLKQGATERGGHFAPRRMQGFHFHIEDPGDYTASFNLSPRAQETAEITEIRLVDQLAGLPDEAIKKEQTLGKGAMGQLKTLTEERKKRDDEIWNSMPPLNLHWQVHGPDKGWPKVPATAQLFTWANKPFMDASRARLKNNQLKLGAFMPLDFVNVETGEVFPSDKVVSHQPWPGNRPDDGTGIYLTKKEFPELSTDMYASPRAELMGDRIRIYLGALGVGDCSYLSLPAEYFKSGDPEVGHDAALALVRLAYDWPAVEMSLHEQRACTHSPSFDYKVDWTGFRRNGKFFYEGWSGSTCVDLMRAYDQLFPYIQDNQLFADEIGRFIPWVKTPKDVIRLLDRYLVFTSSRENKRGLARAAPIEDVAGQVLGYHPLTAQWYDLTRAFTELYPCEGTFQEIYGTAIPRTGTYYGGSFMTYECGEAQTLLQKAAAMADAKARGYKPVMDITDVEKYPKIRAAGQFLMDIFTAGGFPLGVGDASGSSHTSLEAEKRLRYYRPITEIAFRLWSDPRHAWLLKNLHGSQDPAVLKAAEGVENPLQTQISRIIPNAAAVMEFGSTEKDLSRKGSLMLRLGIGRGHSHNDQLDLNIFDMGLPLAVDLACRNEGISFWSRPSASWSFLHNHAITSEDQDPKKAGIREGEPWLRAFEPPLARASYVNEKGTERLDRDVIMMDIGGTGQRYAVDFQKLGGGKFQTWCFHGCESEDLKVNVPMTPAEGHPWLSRLLEGTRKMGKATEVLQATWTMTRKGREVPHKFEKGGVIKTVGCEPTVLGKRFDPALPEVHLRATLLGRTGDEVLQGDAYSEKYAYCFPFLWVQAPAGKGPSVYPAVYEWYRGDTPLLGKIELLKGDGTAVQVTTTSGQIDTFRLDGEALTMVSRDTQGIRLARLSGGVGLAADGITLKAARPKHSTPIVEIDYLKRTLKTGDPLPANPSAMIGNPSRWSNLVMTGKGNDFTWQDDLLIQEGKITSIQMRGPDRIKVETNQKMVFEDAGNRKLAGFTTTDESFAWNFRDGKVVKSPPGGKLSKDVFKDTNGDGSINLKTYEIGAGDLVEVLSDVTVRRVAAGGYEVKTNVDVEGVVAGKSFHFVPGPDWQKIGG